MYIPDLEIVLLGKINNGINIQRLGYLTKNIIIILSVEKIVNNKTMTDLSFLLNKKSVY